MHKIADKEFTLEDFSTEHLMLESIENLEETIQTLNEVRDLYLGFDRLKDKYKDSNVIVPEKKYIWWQMIQLLPSSYNQTRNVMMNYEVLCDIYEWRKDHKLDCWREFCKWIESLPYSELITDPVNKKKKED